MPRERIPVGQHGEIWYEPVGNRWRAVCRYRGLDGNLHKLPRMGDSKERARRNVEHAFAGLNLHAGGDVDDRMLLRRLAELFLEEKAKKLTGGSVASYQSNVKTVVDGVGGLQIREATPMVLQRFIDGVVDVHGHGAAKTCKTVLSGMFRIAVKNGAVNHNPVLELDRVKRPEDVEERKADAIPLDGLRTVFASIETIPALVRNDEVDLCRFMVGAGLRVSEACGLQWDCVDFDTGEIRVERQAERVKREGMRVVPRVKTPASKRRIHIPKATVELLAARKARQQADGLPNPHNLVFPLPTGNIREGNLFEKHLRKNRAALGYPELVLTSHSFRKTCASILEAQGASTLAIRDYLGHEDAVLTEKVYIARNLHTVQTAKTLDAWGGLADL